MNIHEYLEKRASLGKKYLAGKDHLQSILENAAVGGIDSVLAPIRRFKWRKGHLNNYLEFRDTDRFLKGKTDKVPKSLLAPEEKQLNRKEFEKSTFKIDGKKVNMEEYLKDHLEDLRPDRDEMIQNIPGDLVGLSAYGYGAFKGGQKMKNYIQDKRRKK